MILLITPAKQVLDCARDIEEGISEAVQTVSSLSEATTRLRTQEYSVVVVDQFLIETEPDEGEAVLQHIGTALPLQINFAITGTERVIREVRSALHRREREALLARQEAQQALRNELKDTVTALLLSCEVVLQQPNLSEAAQGKMRAVYDLAQNVRSKLGN